MLVHQDGFTAWATITSRPELLVIRAGLYNDGRTKTVEFTKALTDRHLSEFDALRQDRERRNQSCIFGREEDFGIIDVYPDEFGLCYEAINWVLNTKPKQFPDSYKINDPMRLIKTAKEMKTVFENTGIRN